MIDSEVKRYTKILLKSHREMYQIYGLIKPPYGNILNMISNSAFMLYHLKMNFASAVSNRLEKIDAFTRDAKILISKFDMILSDIVFAHIMDNTKDATTVLEVLESVKAKDITIFIEEMYESLHEVIGVPEWFEDAREFIDSIGVFLIKNFKNTEIYFQIKAFLHHLVYNPVLNPVIPLIEVHMDYRDENERLDDLDDLEE